MTEFQFLLNDRISKIQSINQIYNLEKNSYLSFSGGKDSCVLSKLLDLALPNNSIPRVFLNTGIEYVSMVKFVRKLAEEDSQIVIVNSGVNISEMLKTDGYPFKSKEHSQFVHDFQNEKNMATVQRYLNKNFMGCPSKLKYQFTENFSLKISDKCCYRLKKEPAKKWAKENNKTISITGIRKEEKGLRWNKDSCTIFQSGNLKKFHPLMPVDESFINEFIKQYDVQLLELYYEPFNFERTGCKGCPFNPNLRKDLEIMKKFMPTEATNCEKIWGACLF
ncbi:MAG: phosphoadenosine phosphosulfate reductase family protein [Bacteroidales bacterium]|nr:phosphoadenosine phosphosulfate reductase family protein [Candidatus Scybalousia scybalohippi]